jgi:TPP-dependent pyruvate/acetoin dehydrogenase alpha subunit
MAIKNEKLIEMYKTMVRIRTFEERVRKEFAAGNIPGFVHLSSGQEATATGACAALRSDDLILSNHRGHGHVIAKGCKTNLMMAELFGKKPGYCKGKGGSMHIADPDIGVLGANGIVGGGITTAGGAALAAKMRGIDQVTLCFFSDGACNRGSFHEGINWASIRKLPIVYCIENNQYAQTTPIRNTANVPHLADRASAYGIPGKTVDGNDIIAVYEAISEAVDRARKGEGPSIVECLTYRWHGHFEGDPDEHRPKKEREEWEKKDPIPRLRKRLIEMKVFTEEDANKIDQEMSEEINEAMKFAEESPFPEPEEVLSDVYA